MSLPNGDCESRGVRIVVVALRYQELNGFWRRDAEQFYGWNPY